MECENEDMNQEIEDEFKEMQDEADQRDLEDHYSMEDEEFE